MPSGQMGPNNGHSATCRANQRPTREWGEQRLSRTPSIKSGLGDVVAPALVTSSNRRDSKKIEVPTSSTGILARHGSVRAPPPTRHEVTFHNQTCHQPPLPHANHPQPTGLLRSFSLRKKGPEDFLHTSSMPCLAAPPTSSSRERNSNFSVGRIDLNGFQCHLDLCEGWIDLSFESNFQSGWATRGKRRWPACCHHPCLRWSCAQLPCLSGDRLFLGMLGVAI